MPRKSEEEPAYVPLNNLDLLDESGTFDLDTAEDLLDEVPYEPTLDETYADASPETLRKLTAYAFKDGYSAYQTRARELRDGKSPMAMLPEAGRYDRNELIERVLPYIVWRVWKRHLLHTPEVSAMDRVQNGNLYVLEAAQSYDPKQGASLIGMFTPLLDRYIPRPEIGGTYLKSMRPINQGDLIRIAHPQKAYHQIKTFHRGRNFYFGRELEIEELGPLSNFSESELQEYRDLRVEYIPLHLVEEYERASGLPFSDEFIDDDPAVDPERAVPPIMPRDGVDAALSFLSAPHRAALVARTGINTEGYGIPTREVADRLGIDRDTAKSYYYSAVSRLQAVYRIEDIIEGLRPAPESEPELEFEIPQPPDLSEALAEVALKEALDEAPGPMDDQQLGLEMAYAQKPFYDSLSALRAQNLPVSQAVEDELKERAAKAAYDVGLRYYAAKVMELRGHFTDFAAEAAGAENQDPVFKPYQPAQLSESTDTTYISPNGEDFAMHQSTFRQVVSVAATSKYFTRRYMQEESSLARLTVLTAIEEFLEKGLIEEVSEHPINTELTTKSPSGVALRNSRAIHYRRTGRLEYCIENNPALRGAITARETEKLSSFSGSQAALARAAKMLVEANSTDRE